MTEIKVKNKVAYSHEKNGFYELANCTVSRIVNETGKNIISDINDGKDIEMLIYKYCSDEFTKKDLYVFLDSLRQYDYIDFEDSFFEDVIGDNTVFVAGDKEYMEISRCFENNQDKLIYPDKLSPVYYNVMTMRTRSFSNKENLLFDIDENRIGSVIGVQGFEEDKAPIIINSMLSKDGSVNTFLKFYLKAEDFFVKRNKYKVKVLFETKDIPDIVSDFLDKAGFKFEAELKCEKGDKDSIIYSKFLRR